MTGGNRIIVSIAAAGIAVAATSVAQAAEKICVAYHSSAATFNVVDREAKAARAKELGIEIVQADATEDADKQTQQIRDFITAGCTGLIVQAVDATATAVAVKELANSAVPVVTGDRFVALPYGGPGGANPKVHVGWSDFERGKISGAAVVQACKGKDPCRVVLEEGTAGSAPQIEITRGIEAAIAGQANIKIVERQNHNFDPAQAVSVTEAILTKYPKGTIDVIVSHDDNTAIAALGAAHSAGRDELAVVGSGGSKAATDAIAAGKMYGTSMISPTAYGRLAVDTIVHLMHKEPVEVVQQDGRPTVQMKMLLITKDNVADHPGEW
jgi:ribose transport system substrate-binding protein